MKGTYILLIKLPNRCKIRIGHLGVLDFNEGYYAYIGSALNSLEGRIKRHLRNEKKLFWHIDYLLKIANINDIYYKCGRKKEECELAGKLGEKFNCINGFGASDCKCTSHLYYNDDLSGIIDLIVGLNLVKYNT